ncbi:MAG: hypothetical protein ACXWZP_08160, partial [Gaiellaceae bacterium]
ALVVEVTASTDERCPDGVQGRLTLTQDNKRTLEDVMWLRLCGQSHTHLFRGADRDVQVKVGITPRK